MLRKLKLLTPAFLQNFDRYLLLHHPGIWATRIHYVLFFGLLGIGLVFLKASLSPVALNDVPNPENGYYLLFFPVALAIGGWAFFVYLFRTDRNYGEVSLKGELISQGLYFLGLMVLFAAPFVYGLTVSEKLKSAISEEQFHQDIYALNLGEAYFTLQHPDRTYDWETSLVSHFLPYELSESHYNRLIQELQQATPDRQMEHIEQFIQTFSKYSTTPLNISTARVMENFELGVQSLPQLTYDERYYEVEGNLDLLARAQTGRLLNVKRSSLNMLLFSLLFVGFAFVIFVRSNWKQFLFALGASIGSTILLAIFSELAGEYLPAFRHMRDFNIFALGLAALFGFLLVQAFSRRNSKGFTRIKSVSLIMAAGLMPVLFLMSFIAFGKKRAFLIEPYDEEFSLVVIGIFALTFLLWNFIFSKRFRDIQAAPTSN